MLAEEAEGDRTAGVDRQPEAAPLALAGLGVEEEDLGAGVPNEEALKAIQSLQCEDDLDLSGEMIIETDPENLIKQGRPSRSSSSYRPYP